MIRMQRFGFLLSLAIFGLHVFAVPVSFAQSEGSGFRMSGFEIRADKLDRSVAGALSGNGIAVWPGEGAEIPIRFVDVVLDEKSGNAVSGRATSTAAARLQRSGHEFKIHRVHLDASGAKAVLEYQLPAAVATDLSGIDLGEVAIDLDGGFEVERTISLPTPNGVPTGSAPESSPGLAIRLAGGKISVEPIPEKRGRGIDLGLRDVLLRIPIVAPQKTEADRDLFFTEAPLRSYVIGRAARLNFDAAGLLVAPSVQVVPLGSGPVAWTRNADAVIPLFLPAGFGIEFEGGELSLVGGRIAAVDLAGRIHLPEEYDTPPVSFSHLKRRENGSGFATEVLTSGWTRFLIDEYSYRPRQAQLFVPGPLPGGGRGSVLDTGPVPELPTGTAGLEDFEAAVRSRLDESGFVTWGGVLAAPWNVTRPPKPSQTKAPPVAPTTAPPRPGQRPKGGLLLHGELAIDRMKNPPMLEEEVRFPGRTQGGGKADAGLFEAQGEVRIPTDTRQQSEASRTGTNAATQFESSTARPGQPDATKAPTTSSSASSKFVASRVTSRGAVESLPDVPFVLDTGHRNRSPRAAAARQVAARAAAGFKNIDAASQTPANLRLESVDKSLFQFPNRHALQGGALRIGSGGVEGRWVLLQDPETRSIGPFKAQVDRTYIAFSQSTVVRSEVRGRLLIPYPTSLEIPFEGTLTSKGEVLVPEDGLQPPAMAGGWYLDYWKMSVFPNLPGGGVSSRAAAPITTAEQANQKRIDDATSAIRADLLLPDEASAATRAFAPPPPLVFNQDRILVASAGMRPDVDSLHGGLEFRNKNGASPFEMTFAILPDGNLKDVDIRPVDAGGIDFLGIPFRPYRSSLKLRRYVGNHEPPPTDAPPHPGWLLKMEGQLAFSFFGERKVRIHHTAMGARVPFIEPSAKDENGRPAPILADSSGALYVDARLRFVNTFGMPESMIRRRFPPKDVDPNRPFESDGGDNLAIEPFKAFIGEAKIELLGALSVNGLAEAGQWMREDGELNGYEKIGAGGGADVIRAVLAAVRGLETVAQLGGGIVEITTGAEGLGAEVIHVVTDTVVFGSSVVTTAVAVAGVVGSGGGSTATLVEEVRHLIGNGLELGGSSVDLMKAIYLQEPTYEGGNPDAPETHPPYVALEIADIFLSAAALGVNFEEMTPEDVAEVLLQSLDVAIPVIHDMQTGDLNTDQHVDVALKIAHVIVKASLALVRDGEISEELAWQLAQRTIVAAQEFSRLPEIRDIPELKHLPLALLVAQVTVDIGQTLRFGDSLDIATLVDLTDQILTMTCQNPDVVMPLFEHLQLPTRDVMNVMATSQTVFGALNKQELFHGELTPQQVVSQVLLPMIDGFVEGSAAGACAGLVRYDPYDAEVRALLRVARQVLRLADVPAGGSIQEVDHRAMLEWSIATVYETMQAVEVLEPGTVDERVLAGVANFGDAVKSMDPNQPPASQMLRFSHTMMPSVRDVVEAIPNIDPVAPKVVNVVEASLAAAIPLTEGGADDPAIWLDSSLKVVNAVQELPLRADARAGLGIASRALELSRDGARGTLTPPRMVRGAQEIVELLRFELAQGNLQPGNLFATTDPALLMQAQSIGEDDLIRSLAVASAVLDALADALENGRLTIPAIQSLLERVTVALAPTLGLNARGATGPMLAAEGGGFESLAAAISALPILDPTVSAEEATEAVLLALLEEEENSTEDAAVIAAVQRARGALSAPAEKVVNVLRNDLRDIGSYDQERSDRYVDLEGGVRTLHVKTTPGLIGTLFELYLEAEYPVGHSRFPLGLHDNTRIEGNENQSEIISKIRGLEDRIVELATVEFREYGLENGGSVRYERRYEADVQSQFALGVVTAIEPLPGTAFANRVVREVQVPPTRLKLPGEIQGPILEARFEDPTSGIRKHYDSASGRLRLEHTRGQKQGTIEIRATPTGLLYSQTSEIPDGGELLAYIGYHPQNSNWKVEYRRGANEVLVWEGKSFDRLTLNPQLLIDDGPQIPLDGELIERRYHDPATGQHWLYRPGVHALRIDPCGTWELHALGPLIGNMTIPEPSAPLAFIGDALARGDANGSVERADGAALSVSAQEALHIVGSMQGMALLNPEGDTAMLASSGILIVAPGSRRELDFQACAEGGTTLQTHRTPTGERIRERNVDGTVVSREVESTATITRARTIAGQLTSYTRQGQQRRIEVWPLDASEPFDEAGEVSAETLQQLCSADGVVLQRFEFTELAPLFVSAADHAPLYSPPIGDPHRARKILFFNMIEEARQKLAVFPSLEAAQELLEQVSDSSRGERIMRGLGARANRAVASALHVIARGPLTRMDALEGIDDAELQSWLESGEANTPFDELLRALGVAQQANLIVSPELLGGLARAYPQIGTTQHPLRKLFQRVAADQQANCYDSDTQLRTYGLYALTLGWSGSDTCGGRNLLPEIQLGLTELAQAQNGCLNFLKDESLPPTSSVARVERDLYDRMAFAMDLGLQSNPDLTALARLRESHSGGLASRLRTSDLESLSDRQVEQKLQEAVDSVSRSALSGSSDENLLPALGSATDFLADRAEGDLVTRLGQCNLAQVPGCNATTLEGCTLTALPSCNPAAVRRLARRTIDSGANATMFGSERGFDYSNFTKSVEIVVLGAMDRADFAARRKDGVAMLDAVNEAWEAHWEHAALFDPLGGVGVAAIESRTRRLAGVMKTEIESQNPVDDGHESFDGYLHAAMGAVRIGHDMQIDGTEMQQLRLLVQGQIPALINRDALRLEEALAQPAHPVARIDMLIRRMMTAAVTKEILAGTANPDDAGRRAVNARVKPLFLAALDAHPERRWVRPRAHEELLGSNLSQPLSPYAQFAIQALLARSGAPAMGRPRAANYFLDHAERYDLDQKAHRIALIRLIGEVEQLNQDQRVLDSAGPITKAEFEQDPMLDALRRIALRLGDIALAKRFGIYGREQADREAASFRASAEEAEAALVIALQEPNPDAKLVAIIQEELARRQEQASSAEAEAGRRRELPADNEFGEVALVQELERLAGDEPLLVERAALNGRLLTPRLLTISIADRFEAMAAELDSVRDRAGSHGRLARRLAANLPSPANSADLTVRLAAIPQIAIFLVEETGLISPAARGVGRMEAMPAMAQLRGEVLPAAQAGSSWDPLQLLQEILMLTQVRPGQSSGEQVARLAEALLQELGQDTDDPLMRAGLTVTAAGVEGTIAAIAPAAQGQELDWLQVIDATTKSLASVYEPGGPPEDFWLGLAGRMTQVGLQVLREGGSKEAAAIASMQLTFDFLEYPEIDAVVQQIPEPGGQMIDLVKGMMGDSMQNIADGDSFDIALARVVSDASFAQIPAPYGPFGQELTGWALDFVNAHRAEIDAAIADRENPEAWSGVTRALLQSDGIPTLTCLVNEHVEGLEIPPGVALLPFIGGHELLSSRILFEGEDEEKAKAMLDVGAGLMNLWLSGAAQGTCDNPIGVGAEDTPFAVQVRGLKDLDTDDPLVAFNLLGRFGLGAVDTLAPGSTMARALNTVWWGQESAPAEGVPFIGLGSALTGEVDDAIEVALATPKIAGDVIAILAEDPSLEKMMDVLGGNCRAEYLLPPDTCKSNTPGKNEGTLPNLLLSTLADFRRQLRPTLTRQQHADDPSWGYMKTLPALSPYSAGVENVSTSASPATWEQTVAAVTNLEQSTVKVQKAGMAAVDVARMAINALNSLPTVESNGPTAQHIQDSSVFIEQTGGEMFSGVAGGMMREWELGTDPADADVYFELVGQFVIPALVRSAAQFTYQNQGDDWMMMIRAGSNYPDLTAVAEKIGVSIPLNEIASVALGKSESHLAGWMGVADDAPYFQLYSKSKYSLGSQTFSESTMSGFANDFGPGESFEQQFADMDLGMCAEMEQALIPAGNPYLSMFTLGVSPKITLGGYIFKQNATFGAGSKIGVSTDFSIPLFPIAGVEIGADIGSAFEATYDGDWFPEAQLSTCIRPFIAANFFGIQLADISGTVDVAVFGDMDEDESKVGVKIRMRIAEDYYDLMRENLGCEAPGPLEFPMCVLIDLSGDDLGGWMTMTDGTVYFGLGSFPNNGDQVLAVPFLADGGVGIPELRTVAGWGGFTASPYDTCADDICGGIDEPPPGAVVRSQPSLEGE